MQKKTARLTILVNPEKKKIFEEICAARDLTSSQVLRQLMREYILQNGRGYKLPNWLTEDLL